MITKFREKLRLLNDLLKQEEIFWFQRSRALWLKDGDRNIPFFHKKASHRRQRNTIHKIKNHEGMWVSGDDEVVEAMREFFVELFESE